MIIRAEINKDRTIRIELRESKWNERGIKVLEIVVGVRKRKDRKERIKRIKVVEAQE